MQPCPWMSVAAAGQPPPCPASQDMPFHPARSHVILATVTTPPAHRGAAPKSLRERIGWQFLKSRGAGFAALLSKSVHYSWIVPLVLNSHSQWKCSYTNTIHSSAITGSSKPSVRVYRVLSLDAVPCGEQTGSLDSLVAGDWGGLFSYQLALSLFIRRITFRFKVFHACRD